MKKFLCFICVLLVAVSFAFSFAACGTDGKQSSAGNSSSNNQPTGNGGAGNEPPAQSLTLSKNDYKKVFQSVSDSYESYINSLNNASPMAVRLGFEENDFVNECDSTQLNIVDACIWLIRFSKNLCDNPSFVLTDKSQQCYIKDKNNFEYKLKFLMSYDEDNNTVSVRQYCEQDGSTVYVYGLTFDIIYDFTTETLSEFSILGVMGRKGTLTKDDVQYYKFKSNQLKCLSHSSNGFTAFAEQSIADVNAFAPDAWETNLSDYSAEYIAAEPVQS